MQAERQLSNFRNPRIKTPPKPLPKKPPIRIPKPKSPNKTEARFVADHPGTKWLYEALSFQCPSGRYTPDWIGFSANGAITAVEVKGNFAFASQPAAAAKFKECLALYPAVRWVWAKWTGREWLCSATAAGEPRT